MATVQHRKVQKVVIRRTFIEVLSEPSDLHAKPRASSLSALDRSQKPCASFRGSCEAPKPDAQPDLDGLSDAETTCDPFSACSDLDRILSNKSRSTSASWSSGITPAAPTGVNDSSSWCPSPCEAAADKERRDHAGGDAHVEMLRRENEKLRAENERLRQSAKLTTESTERRDRVRHAPPRSPAAISHAAAGLPMPPWLSEMPQEAAVPQGATPACILSWIAKRSPASTPSPEWPSRQSSRPKNETGGKGGEDFQVSTTLPFSHTSPSLEEEVERCTTVMLRNLPNNYTRTMVIDMLNKEGFYGKFDFMYLPMDFQTHACLGYAFVNLVDPSLVPQFYKKFDGYTRWGLSSRKVCSVTWRTGPQQGLEALVGRYRDSPVMHRSVPEAFRPVMLQNGEKVPFPAPTRAPRAPRTRNCKTE